MLDKKAEEIQAVLASDSFTRCYVDSWDLCNFLTIDSQKQLPVVLSCSPLAFIKAIGVKKVVSREK